MREELAPGSRWQSATRPLLVRTVWVDGLRHAVLSPGDDLAVSRIVATAATPLATPLAAPAPLGVVKASPPPPESELAKCLVRWALVAQPPQEDHSEDETPPPPSSPSPSPQSESSSPSLTPSQVSSRPSSPSPAPASPPPAPPRQQPARLPTPPPPPLPPAPIALCDRVIQWLDLARRFPPPSSKPLPSVQSPNSTRGRTVASAQRSPANTPQRRVMTARRSASFGDTLPPRNRPALIQVYRAPPPSVPLRAWVTDAPRTKQQLHIFVPAVERRRSEEEANESGIE